VESETRQNTNFARTSNDLAPNHMSNQCRHYFAEVCLAYINLCSP